jgi:hypothetical protein
MMELVGAAAGWILGALVFVGATLGALLCLLLLVAMALDAWMR